MVSLLTPATEAIPRTEKSQSGGKESIRISTARVWSRRRLSRMTVLGIWVYGSRVRISICLRVPMASS